MNRDEIEAANQRVIEAGAFVQPLLSEAGKVIVGQSYLMERLVISLLANGHVLLEGVPGLAKTLAIKTLADTLNANFSRIQFTPDMLPADVTGTQIYNPQSGEFTTRQGPVFANLVLADEINRAPAKVQSALLEAMQEKQVTIGATTYPLPSPFLVLATENPTLSSLAISLTHGNRRFTMSTEPSTLLLSTTQTSTLSPLEARSTDTKHCSRNARTL